MSKKVQLLESWGEICGTLANPSRGVVYVLDLESDRMSMALYEQVSELLDKYKDDDVIFIEVYQEDN
jgi:hypothetical protein